MSIEIAKERILKAKLEGSPELDLSNVLSSILVSGIDDLRVKLLYPSAGELSSLLVMVSNLQNLTYLDLSGNELSSLPAEIAELKNLTYLDLSGNKLSSLPAEIAELKNLTYLDLSRNILRGLLNVVQLVNLILLDISENSLRSLPAKIAGLQNLKRLSLSGNKLSSLPAEIAELKNLTHLDLSGNKLSSLPAEITELKSLEALNLNRNRLGNLPAEITELKNLGQLFLAENKLIGLPPIINELRNLRKLNLRGNTFKSLPLEITKIKKLIALNLGGNKLSFLPNEISELENLTYLDLSYNQFGSLPGGVTELKNLTELYLSGNKLSSLPAEIAELKNLTVLYLSYNQLSSLPPKIVKFRHLKLHLFKDSIRKSGINFYGNKATLEYPPEEVLEQGWDAVENYFKQSEEQSLDKMYEAKLVLIGEGRAGKTSLMKALMKEGFDPQEETTHGINVRSMILTPEETGLDRDFRLNLWDFGGQDIYKDTHRFFLTKDTIYVLVTENRKIVNFDDIYYWLHSIEQFAPRAPVILVQNKCEADIEDISFQEYKRKFENVVPWSNLIRTSCKEGQESTIQQLKQNIIRVITDNDLKPSVGDAIPARWVDVRQAIFEQQEVGIALQNYDDFEKQCSKYKLSPQDVETLAGYFFRIGVFTHYAENPLLRRTVFLNNGWLTKGVYKIIDDATVKEQKGRFSRGDIIIMYRGTAYEKQEAEFIELMKEFKICYELENGSYITPLRLPADIPEIVNLEEWQQEDTLHFAFDYQDFMPRGILSTFIVDMHKDIDADIVWLHGVVLTDQQGNRALVKEDREKSQINIFVKGRDKRSFLSVLTRSFQEIHRELNDLPHKRKIACNCSFCSQVDNEPYFHDAEVIFRRFFNGVETVMCDKSDETLRVAAIVGELIVIPMIRDQESMNEARKTIIQNYGVMNMADKKNDFTFHEKAQGIFGGENNSGNTFTQDNRDESQTTNVTVDTEALAAELDKLTSALIGHLGANPTDTEAPQALVVVNQAKGELAEGNTNKVLTTLKNGGSYLLKFARDVAVDIVANVIQGK